MSGTADSPRSADLGSKLFDNRRWVHPVFILSALAIGGAHPDGRLAGIALLVVLIAVRIWAARYLGGAAHVHARKAQQKRVLVTDGPFAWVRNPLYLANSFGLAGYCLLLGPPWLAATALVVSLLWYRAVVAWEEKVLADLYGQEYRDYQARVPRLLPRPPSGIAGSARKLYPWAKAVRREHGALYAALALIVLSFALEAVGPLPWQRG